MRDTRPDASVESSKAIDDRIQATPVGSHTFSCLRHSNKESVVFIRIDHAVRRASLSDLSLPPQALWT